MLSYSYTIVNMHFYACSTRFRFSQQKLVQVILHKKLSRVSVILVGVYSCTSFLSAVAHNSVLGQRNSGT